MRWKSHSIVTGSLLFAMGFGPGNILMGMISSVLPDWVETPFGPHLRLLSHRGISHELSFYLFPFLALVFFYPELSWQPPILWDHHTLRVLPFFKMIPESFMSADAFRVSAWVVPLGGLLHLLLGDIFNPGGITIFFKRESFRLFYTDSPYKISWGERIFTFGFLIFSIVIYRFSQTPFFFNVTHSVMPLAARYWWIIPALIFLALVLSRYGVPFPKKQDAPQKLLGRSPVAIINLPYRKAKSDTKNPCESNASPREKVDMKKETAPVSLPNINFSRWKYVGIQNFYKTEIQPNLGLFSQDVLLFDAILSLLDMLDKDGNIPSVCGADEETRFSQTSFDRLAKVTLRDHLLHTVIVGKQILQAQFGQYFMLSYPKFVVAALGHDIGKCHIFSKDGYHTGDHPITSANVVLSLLPDHKFADDIGQAIRDHHQKTPLDKLPVFVSLLIRADNFARQEENEDGYIFNQVATKPNAPEKSPGHPSPAAPFPETTASGLKSSSSVPELRDLPKEFPMDILLKKMRAKMNFCNPQRPSVWLSVSQQDGTVYYHVDFLHSLVSETAEEAGIKDIWFFDKNLRNSLLYSVFSVWKRKKWAAGSVGPTYYCKQYEVENKKYNEKRNALLVGIRVEALGISVMTAERERLENNITRYISIPFPQKNP